MHRPIFAAASAVAFACVLNAAALGARPEPAAAPVAPSANLQLVASGQNNPDDEEIEAFGQKNDVPKRVVRSLMMLFEEVVTQLLLPRLPEPPRILWTVEYEPKREYAEVSVRYNGEHFDVMESDNEISLRIVKGSSENIRYAAEDGEMPNCLSLTVRHHMEPNA